MNGKTGEPVPVWASVLGVLVSVLVGVGGVLLAIDEEEGFTIQDSVGPGIVGLVSGLLVAALVLWLYYAVRWRPDPRMQVLPIPLLAGLGIAFLYLSPAIQVGIAMACTGLLLPLMVWGGIVSRREGTSWPRAQEPDSPGEG